MDGHSYRACLNHGKTNLFNHGHHRRHWQIHSTRTRQEKASPWSWPYAIKARPSSQKREIARTVNGEVDYVVADLASLKEVRQSAETFQQRYPRLDVLIFADKHFDD